MANYFNREGKPFMKMGPQKISKELQRTQCSLLLNCSEDDGEDTMKVFRGNHDTLDITYNICDLPEIPSRDRKVNESRLALSNTSKYDTILNSMSYNEPSQLYLLNLKPYPIFKDHFEPLNEEIMQITSPDKTD